MNSLKSKILHPHLKILDGISKFNGKFIVTLSNKRYEHYETLTHKEMCDVYLLKNQVGIMFSSRAHKDMSYKVLPNCELIIDVQQTIQKEKHDIHEYFLVKKAYNNEIITDKMNDFEIKDWYIKNDNIIFFHDRIPEVLRSINKMCDRD